MIELLLWCALCGPPAQLRTRPSPRPHISRFFLLESSALAAAETADAITTRRLIDRGGFENNAWLMGRRPSAARQAGVNAGLFAGQLVVFYFTERSRHRAIRWFGRAVLAGEITVHAQLAACNAGVGLRERCPRL